MSSYPDQATQLWYQSWSTTATLVVVALLLVSMGLLLALVRAFFRRTDNSAPTRPSAIWILLFAAWAAFTGVGLFWIGTANQATWVAMDRSRREPIVIQVMGQQYAWSFRLPGPDGLFGPIHKDHQSADNPFGIKTSDPHGADDEVILGELQTTAGLAVTFEVRSLDVLHSFYLPEFRNQVNAMPGRLVHVTVGPVVAGDYAIACNQFCGLGHYRMVAPWKVIPAPSNNPVSTHEGD